MLKSMELTSVPSSDFSPPQASGVASCNGNTLPNDSVPTSSLGYDGGYASPGERATEENADSSKYADGYRQGVRGSQDMVNDAPQA